jgi:signal transduction histidine kinase
MLSSVRGDVRELSAFVWHEAYRIGRKGILIAYKHSGAEKIHVAIDYEPGGLRVCVEDKGRGIRASELALGRPGHWGIQGMRERAKRIGATLEHTEQLRGGY